MNLGILPTAYVEIDKNNKLFKKNYNDIANIYVHGGLTYSRSFLQDIKKDTWFIGWDYGHAGDYLGYEIIYPNELRNKEDKKWTTEEIYEDVKNVIDQIIEVNNA